MASDRKLTAFFLGFAARHKWRFLLSVLAMPIYAYLVAEAPNVMRRAIDDGIMAGDRAATIRHSLVYLGCMVGGALGLVAQHWFMQSGGIRTLTHMREAVMRHILGQGRAEYDKRPLGVYVSRSTSDVEAIGETMTAGLTNLIADTLLIVFIFVNMVAIDRKLGLMTLVIVPVVVVVVDIFRRILRPLYDRIRTVNGTLTSQINEVLGMHGVIRSFHLQGAFNRLFREDNDEYRDTNIKAVSYDAAVFSILEGLSFVAIGGVLLYIAVRATGTEKALQLGAVVAFIQWLQMLFPPLKQMGARFAILQSALAAVSKLETVMQIPLPVDEGTKSPENLNLTVRDLTFAYNKEQPVLKNVALEVPAGKSLAVVGPTGSGKSTLIRLIVRQFDLNPGGGEILLGGTDLREILREDLRKKIVLIPQEPSIFEETVRYNISLDRPEVTMERIESICRKIRAHDFIQHLPHGYDTVIAGEGANLSMGQRQLIAMARALATDAQILIFDEATANIDTETERLIQEALDYVMATRTTILIAHRLSTIRDADQILVLNHGEIMERGTHDALMTRPGLYRRMYELQRHAIPDQ